MTHTTKIRFSCMILSTLVSLILLFSPPSKDSNSMIWGKTGHRVVGEVAANYLTAEAKKEIKRILGHESMAIASTWMDEIRSDPAYNHTHDWHWVTVPDGMTYEQTEKNPNGDLIDAIISTIEELSEGSLMPKEEEKKLKMLIHLVGDIHQPLHVGTGEDRGGNLIDVEWFYEPSNLHRVWDSEMIDDSKLSYTELSASINHPTRKQIDEWQNSGVMDWVYEAVELRNQVYDLPDDLQLGYRYQYKNFDTVEKQLLKGGIRLAGVLNDIYGT